jgi:hypothetical protein
MMDQSTFFEKIREMRAIGEILKIKKENMTS